ncbi:unnamed protein product [Peronospora belbahrii]|uniref:Nudix hydrolase domain-containing protein n=1 Tax=Peronospora belbahrii TaxID=622444 RepID=A0AAU9L3Q9_9STRA|nr:unnamed protein product [Peronospora belbahrii]CAH0522087.1 unnamed protein product [Peronospora belbahrii]
MTVSSNKVPKKKRRTLRDAEDELATCRNALQEAKRQLVLTARENAKMKVLLMKYIEKDESLVCSSQLTESSSQPTTSVIQNGSISPPAAETDTSAFLQSPPGYTTTEEEESEESLWNRDFQPCGDGFTEPISQLSQISQVSHWSGLSSTSNLDAIMNFLETQGTSEVKRLETLQAEYTKPKEQKTVVCVGVGVLLMSKKHPECVLIGQRKDSHGEGKFALPGGHLEMYESWEECAIREVKEETDLDLMEAHFATVTNDPMEDEGKHYITILMQAIVDEAQTVRNMEPNKCEGWSWMPWSELRTRDDMFTPLLHVTHSNFTPSFIKP